MDKLCVLWILRNFFQKFDCFHYFTCPSLVFLSPSFILLYSMMSVLHQRGHGHSHGGGGHERKRREVEEGEERGRWREGGSGRTAKKKGLHNKNINVHAAFIHVVGDLIQSIGIVIAGYIIWFKVCRTKNRSPEVRGYSMPCSRNGSWRIQFAHSCSPFWFCFPPSTF